MYAKISQKINTSIQKFYYNEKLNEMGAILDLKKFKYINWLECYDSNLGSIININKNIIYINCSINSILVLDNLPEKLNTLNCSGNKITNLDNLPEKLKKLICSNNKITNLDNLPPNLEYLDCVGNNIQKLDNLSWNIKELVVGFNEPYTLDYLPESLKIIVFCDVYNNWRKKELNLKNLPVSLEIIHFNTNELPKIIGNISNWEFKKNHIINKKYIEIHEQPKTFSPTYVDYLDYENIDCENYDYDHYYDYDYDYD